MHKMKVIPILLVISMCEATVVHSTVRISKHQYTQLIYSEDYSSRDTAGTSTQEETTSISMTTDPLPSVVTSADLFEGLTTYQDRSSPITVHTKSSYSNERSTIKEAADQELLLTSFTTPSIMEFAEYSHDIARRTDMVFISRNTFLSKRMHDGETMFTSQQFTASLREYNIDASHINKTASHELEHLLMHSSPTFSNFAFSDYESSKADDRPFYNKLNINLTNSSTSILRVSDIDPCTSNCTCKRKSSNCTRKRKRLVCFSGLPCFIPKTVKNIQFFYPNYVQLVKEFRHKFNNESFFNSVTKLKLDVLRPDLGLKQNSQDIQEFLSLFPSLRKISFAGENRLECKSAEQKHFRSVKILNEKVCTSLIIFSNMLNGKISCFPNLKSITIRLRHANKCFHINVSHEYTILLNFLRLRVALPFLENLHIDNTRTVSYLLPPTVEIVLIDNYIYGCNNSSLLRIYITSFSIWTDIMYIRCHCPCPLIVFDSKAKIKVLREPKDIDINGVKRVEFLSRVSNYGKCKNKRKGQYFAKIEFTFGSSLRIERNCRDGKLKMTFDNYYRNLTYVLWHIEMLEDPSESLIKLNALNLSKRNISYILFHEGYFGGLLRVQNVILSSNQLGRMAKYQSLEFEKILFAFTKLRVIDLAGNDISKLPEEIFSKSRNLKSVVLSSNDLTTLRMAHFSQMTKLKKIDLSNNNIKTTVGQLQEINHFLSLRNWSMVINMSENAFECSCTNSFISLSKINDNKTFIVRSHCELENSFTIQYDRLEYHCERQKILTIQIYSLAITCSFLAVALFAIIAIWKIRKQKRLTDRFVRNVKHGLSKKEFLIFLSYSSKDGEMAHKQILPEITKRVIERTGVDKEHICTGDTHFIPGFNIIQEAMRCINICSVVVFVMTKSFVLSPFCRMEVKEALDQAKPIILIIKGDIDKRKMPRIIKNNFNKYSRFHFIRGINGIRVLPGWDLLVSAIFDLAALEERDIQVLEQLENEGEENVGQVEEIEMREVKRNIKRN